MIIKHTNLQNIKDINLQTWQIYLLDSLHALVVYSTHFLLLSGR